MHPTSTRFPTPCLTALIQVISEGPYLRFLLGYGLRHQLIDLRAVIGHGHHEERLVVCEQHMEHKS